MEIRFRTRKLEKQFAESIEAEKAYGRTVARKFIQRVLLIKQVRDIQELEALPGLRCHPLKGSRQGQWAVKLTGFHRLILGVDEEDPETVYIEEVSKHDSD